MKKNFYTISRNNLIGIYLLYSILFVILLMSVQGCRDSNVKATDLSNGSGKIIIEADISKHFYGNIQDIFSMRDEIKLKYKPFLINSVEPPSEVYTLAKRVNEKIKWIIYSNIPLIISPPLGEKILVNPGDSIFIRYKGSVPIYSGNDEQGMRLLNSLMLANERLLEPETKLDFKGISLTDFFEWNNYLNNKLLIQLSIIDTFIRLIPQNKFEYYKTIVIDRLEGERLNAFSNLRFSIQHKYLKPETLELKSIWDSTQCNQWRKWLQSISNSYVSIEDSYRYSVMQVLRKFDFNEESDSLKTNVDRGYLYYANSKQNYTGLMRERLMAYILNDRIIKELGTKNPMSQKILNDYYNQPGFPEYKTWVKEHENVTKY